MPTMDNDILNDAEKLLESRPDLAGKRMRLLRALVYEGIYEDVAAHIAKSRPVGTEVISEGLTITVAQGEYAQAGEDVDTGEFKVGDRVKIARRTEGDDDLWLPEMDDLIGEVGTIVKIEPETPMFPMTYLVRGEWGALYFCAGNLEKVAEG